MIICVKGGPRRRIQRSLQSAEVLSGEMPSTKICLRTELGLSALLPLSAMYTMKFWLRLRQPVSWFQNEVAFTILLRKRGTYFSVVTEIRENAPEKANDLRLVCREPQEHFDPERVFRDVPRSCFTSYNFIG